MMNQPVSRKRVVIAAVAIFMVAFGMRLLSRHDTQQDVRRVQTVVAEDYQRTARLLREGGIRGFFSSTGPMSDPNLLGHPPGYPIVIAVVWKVFGESDRGIQLFQIFIDSLAAVLVLLIAIELLPFPVGVIGGALVGFAPQFTWNSVLLLPDTLAVFPLLLAVYCLARALKNPRLLLLVLAGVFIGVSCWLRANALLMAPFLAVVVFFMFEKPTRLRFASAFLAAAVLVVAPLTIRNWVVFHHFIPVSLGVGQTMLEGIADYDPQGSLGIPNTDMGIMKQEAEQFGRPDYYSTLFAPDGIQRDRQRVSHGFSVVVHHPLWFASVMLRRGLSMLRLERTPRISIVPTVTYAPGDLNTSSLIETIPPNAFVSKAVVRAVGEFVGQEGSLVRLDSDYAKHRALLVTSPLPTKPSYEHVLVAPVVVHEGRVKLAVVSRANRRTLFATTIDKAEVKDGQPQPMTKVELPFAGDAASDVMLICENAVGDTERTVVDVGAIQIFAVRPAGLGWTRYPRLVIRGLQSFSITAIMLPLELLGLLILIKRRAWKTLLVLLAAPAYYLIFQSILHTEYRYVLLVHYLLFIFAALALYQSRLLTRSSRRLVRKRMAKAPSK